LASRTHSWFRAAAISGDIFAAVCSLYLAFLLRTTIRIPGTEQLLPAGKAHFNARNIILVSVVQVFALSLFGLYGARERLRDPLARLLIPALLLQLALISAFYFLAFPGPGPFPRSVLVVYIMLNGIITAFWRAALEPLFPQPKRRALVVGTGNAASLIIQAIRRHPWTGVEVVGCVGDAAGAGNDLKVLGPVQRLAEIAERERVDEVILTPESPSWRDGLPERIPRDWPADLLVWPSPFETMIGRLRFRIVGDLPLLEAKVRPLEGLAEAGKRLFDIVVSIALLCAGLPVAAVAALAVAATSRGGVLYRQKRVGKDGRLFDLWKLRTMRAGAEQETGAVLASRGDARITLVGRLLRAARIDEIPQLWNVLIGDMSLVGPRPERPEFTERFSRSVAGYSLRHSVRPGLTGLAQVSGDYSTEPEIKLRYDLAYLNNWSFGLDLAILMRTLPVVLTRRGV
jgi:exopolysaccharide biosynthesis polyprenyl glycosylphosphotransferase